MLTLLLMLAPSIAAAQTIVPSPKPDSVGVTVYRDPHRGSQPFDLNWLNGYALISETRRVRLPAGESELRFEGVAGGIIPQSAIVSGLPNGIVERNRDALLLSPGTLLDRSLGRRVHLRRTSAAGKVSEQEAVIRSGADGAVVLQTKDGIEALRCSGQKETLIYDEVPPDLSARPTLSVRTRSREAVDATVTLSYLATGFDWQANYVATLNPAGDRLDLFAWLTLANGDATSFAGAKANAVAGRLNRENADVPEPVTRPLLLNCWPEGTTSDTGSLYPPPPAPPPPPMSAPMPVAEVGYDQIVVTGSRSAMKAELEALGDVKLYRIPEPVTVAANSQKQVALIEKSGVKVDVVYRQRLFPAEDSESSAVRTIVTRNRVAEGLGVPLPAGGLVLFAQRDGRPLLIGEGSIADSAVGEDVEIAVGTAPGVRAVLRVTEHTKGSRRAELQVSNDSPAPIRYEAEFLADGARLKADRKLGTRDGRPLWAVTIPANGRATLRYSIKS